MRGPMGDFVRRALSWGIVSSLLLPILALVVIGLGALLAAPKAARNALRPDFGPSPAFTSTRLAATD